MIPKTVLFHLDKGFGLVEFITFLLDLGASPVEILGNLVFEAVVSDDAESRQDFPDIDGVLFQETGTFTLMLLKTAA